jgi:hypothetical protein
VNRGLVLGAATVAFTLVLTLMCAHSTVGSMRILSDFFVFDPPAPIWYPTFRHLSLEREIDSGHLPRPMQHPQAVHPAFASTSYPLESKAEILASCH